MPIDYSRYPANWQSEIVPRILARAMGCCEFCRIPNNAEATSIPLRIQDVDGRYKIKRFWLTAAPDIERMKPFAVGGQKVKQVRVVLTVAHLDHDEMNPDVADDRLAALCQYCHLNYDAAEKYRRAVARSPQPQLSIVSDIRFP